MTLAFWKKAENVAKEVLAEVPQIFALIMQAEATFGVNAGLQKKTFVLASLAGASAPLLAAAATLIDATVTALNAAGVFSRTAKVTKK